MSISAPESPVTAHDLQVFGEEVLTAFLLDQDQAAAPQPGDGAGRVHASIAVSGGWSGRVTLDVSRTGADVLAARMLQADEVSEADVVDAVGELVNVLGGNVKGLLLEESALGLPQVSTTVDENHTHTAEFVTPTGAHYRSTAPPPPRSPRIDLSETETAISITITRHAA